MPRVASTGVDTPHYRDDQIKCLSQSALPTLAFFLSLQKPTHLRDTDAPVIPPGVARELYARVHSSDDKGDRDDFQDPSEGIDFTSPILVAP